MKIKEIRAHCDIPCAVYDPGVAQYAALSVLRFLDLIGEMPESIESKKDLAHLSRLVQQKEEHAIEVKDAVRTIWGDYFKQPHMEKYPEIHDLAHSIMMIASKCKQDINRQNGVDLVDKVNRFAEIFWATKDINTETKKSLNPPHVDMIFPMLGD
jgi:nickel superoxide dismutase|tara:strand:+ start:624 stop:1088 length:465 start_codon:yes stop_codon:yes gene_type:complete